jgi:hypothetical protein
VRLPLQTPARKFIANRSIAVAIRRKSLRRKAARKALRL